MATNAASETIGPNKPYLALADERQIYDVPIASIRVDGETQHRTQIDAGVVAEYAALMKGGVEFPPVRVWRDGSNYWLTDGFHRLAAARQIGLSQLRAEVLQGSLIEARSESYASNAVHGVRRTPEETRRVIRLALAHPNAARRSNVEVARHLHVSEATVRRLRQSLSSSRDEDGARVVRRGESTYVLQTATIGHHASQARHKSRRELRTELASMKERSSPQIRRLLNIVGNWVLGRATSSACLEALERVASDWGRSGDGAQAAECGRTSDAAME